jgi:hypothetical protein
VESHDPSIRGHGSESCENCHNDDFIYECNDLEWVKYLLDDAPAEDGVYLGDSSPGIPAYAGYSILESAIGTGVTPGRIQITEPKGMFTPHAPGYFSNDTFHIFYLKDDCKKYKFEWVPSKSGEIIPFAVEPLRPMINGFHDYVARKSINSQKTVFGAGIPGKATIFYIDETNEYPNQLVADRGEYEVLTCKAKKCI